MTIAADLSEHTYRQATAFLSSLDDDWARHIAATGPCRHAAKPARAPYEALVRAIAYQQLHARAGDAILGRLLALYPGVDFPSPGQLLDTGEATLRGCGFSATKLATIRGLAQATLDGVVPTRDEALAMPDEALVERLVTLRGVGRWTVEMLLIYTLERADILPADDFGVREGYRRLKRLESAPTRKQMTEIGRAWSPYRTIAAWYLWRMPTG
ncbi:MULTISPECIES: DNA-3-methyladenine glycosylase family protein [Ralstonia solanacearum species complex]|uniref:DNA-3-methyladenine glycosylase family protein n=1 Tax=Ralstonia solanacearum species complex TaxID=3116862 RepID=UPI000E568357|nr:DNA-3-methyladenine glycosylase [Ralstonia solanacearum]BEU71229.1 DNA-3-methyladenine glycosylase [Ralstonia pseudosolanacearum]AXV76205.1 DNA-3-methyladenine glycosylase [Ralstonia solanacearum]AXV90213.1 DNA-3-methyladenine glycosylase [Ralstonia solanacearum]AXW18402.1 DNA-3-methyladenine glycosylase [Ralstonia solanacearum]AXW75123.1 DNA-3-methyladenine glycosylase [Ralstonia solanacearum]